MLLDGEAGEALDRVERDLTEARREHDRAVALDEELRHRLAEAEQRERIDALIARKTAAEKASRDAARDMENRVPKLVADLVAIRDRVQAAHAEVIQVNAALEAIGSTDRVADTPLRLDEIGRHNEGVIARLDRPL